MTKSEPPKKPGPTQKPLSIDELRQMVSENIEEQRKIADSVRRKMN